MEVTVNKEETTNFQAQKMVVLMTSGYNTKMVFR